MSKKIHTSSAIIAWLQLHPLISVSALERSADIPATILLKAIKGSQLLSEKHIPPLVLILKKYGYK